MMIAKRNNRFEIAFDPEFEGSPRLGEAMWIQHACWSLPDFVMRYPLLQRLSVWTLTRLLQVRLFFYRDILRRGSYGVYRCIEVRPCPEFDGKMVAVFEPVED